MSSSVYAAIVGNGKTTRSNVEALIGDFSEAIESLIIYVESRQDIDEPKTEAGAWVKQFAEAKEIPVELKKDIYADIEQLLQAADAPQVKLFVLWDDDDLDCQVAAAFAQRNDIPAFDLTNGLVRIPTDLWDVEAPVASTMPDSEMNVSEEPGPEPAATFIPPQRESIFEAEQEPIPLWGEDDEEFEPEMSGAELIEAALEEAGRIIARSFVTEMLRMLRGDDDDTAE